MRIKNRDQNSGPGTSAIAVTLTFPSRSQNSTDGNEQVVPSQPQQAINLQDLLQLVEQAIKEENAYGHLQLVPLNAEQRRFVEKMKRTIVNLPEPIHRAIEVLTDKERIYRIKANQTIPIDIKAAFDILLEYIDHPRVAVDFCKVGGLDIFPVCYGSKNVVIRTLTTTALGEMCECNSYCQAKVLVCGLIRVLVKLAGTEKGYALNRTIFALSCAIQRFEPGCHEFVAQGGCATLVKVLEKSDSTTRKSTFLLICILCHNIPQCRVKFIETKLVSVIARQFKITMNQKIQLYLSILQDLIKDPDPRLTEQIRNPKLRLKKTLEALLELPQLQGNLFEKENEFCRQILARGFGENLQLDEKEPDG